MSSRRSLLVAVATLTVVAGCDGEPAAKPEKPKREKHEVVYEVEVNGSFDYSSLEIAYRDQTGSMDSTKPNSMAWLYDMDIEDTRITEVSVDAVAAPEIAADGLPEVPPMMCAITIDGVERARSTGRGTVSCQVRLADTAA